MSNKSISVYAEAMRRQKEMQSKKSPTPKAKSPAPKNKIKARSNDSNTARDTALHIACDIAISKSDIDQLREMAYKATSFRLTTREVKWLKRKAFDLDEEVKRGEVHMVHIVRLGIKLIEKILETDKNKLVDILEQTK